jgi:hypothetical protein
MVGSLMGSMGIGTKENESSTERVWAAGFHHPFSLGARFETYEPFISLIFLFFFSGRRQPRITETADTESADTGVRLYLWCLRVA